MPVVVATQTLFFVLAVARPYAFSQQNDGRIEEHESFKTIDRLQKLQQELSATGKDLLDHRRAAGKFSPEARIIDGMLNSLNVVQTYVTSAGAVVGVSRFVTGVEEKSLAQSYVNLWLQGYSTQTDLEVERVNSLLSESKTQAVVTAGNKLKAEMDTARHLFDAARTLPLVINH